MQILVLTAALTLTLLGSSILLLSSHAPDYGCKGFDAAENVVLDTAAELDATREHRKTSPPGHHDVSNQALSGNHQDLIKAFKRIQSKKDGDQPAAGFSDNKKFSTTSIPKRKFRRTHKPTSRTTQSPGNGKTLKDENGGKKENRTFIVVLD